MHLPPTNAAGSWQYWQLVGLPYCATFASHRLQIVLVLLLLKISLCKG